LATSKAVRADDVSGLNIATASFTEDAVTKDVQRVIINNSTDGTMATVNATGLKVDASGAAVPVTVAATLNVRPSDGTNPITKTFDLDSGVGTEYNVGVGLRKVASGGSVEAGTSTDPLRTDPTGTTVQPVSGTVSITANSAVNVAQVAGTTTDTNSGVKSAGTLRVVLATDQPALTNKLLVTPDSVALPANQSVNVSQINGVTPLMGNGVTGTGSQRVTIASDNTAFTVNAAQSGAWSVGSSTATGSAVPANAFYEGGIAKTALPAAATDGNLTGAMVDKFGRQVCLIGSIRDLTGTQTTTLSASTAETTIVTQAASIFNDLVMLIVSNTSAATNTRIDFRDTTAGTVLFSLFSVGGAAPVGFALPVPIPQTTVNTNWTAQCATSTTDIRIYAVFVKNK
jgi:hypothetical protein